MAALPSAAHRAANLQQPQSLTQLPAPHMQSWGWQGLQPQPLSPGRQSAAGLTRHLPTAELSNRSVSSSASEQDQTAAVLYLEPHDDLAAGAVWRLTRCPSLSVMYRSPDPPPSPM